MARTGRIDVHSHLLPGIDDGCPSFQDAAQCARMLVAAGYTHAFCTPHVWPSLPHNDVASIRTAVEQLQRRLDEDQVPLRVLPGGEVNLVWSWPALSALKLEQVPTYGMEGRYVLFDFWAERMLDCIECIESGIAHLQSLGLRLILAHPERVAALHADPGPVYRLNDTGVLLQMNTWCLTDPPASPTYRLAERLLREERYFCFGTDCHNAASMPNRIDGLRVATELVGQEKVDQLTIENPRRLLPPLR